MLKRLALSLGPGCDGITPTLRKKCAASACIQAIELFDKILNTSQLMENTQNYPYYQDHPVFNLFVTACNNIGIPSRVRSDCGSNIYELVSWCWRGSHIAGTSVLNQRIQHLWRDVYVTCTSLLYHLFHSLEDCGLLDPESDIHLYALQYVYKQIITHFGGIMELASINFM